MWSRLRSSRRKYGEYRSLKPGEWSAALGDVEAQRAKRKRARSFGTLFRAFWRLIAGHRVTLFLALLTLSVATGIGLLMPAATKVVVDYILTDHPGPSGLPEWLGLRGRDRQELLWMLAGAMVGASLLGVMVSIGGRWQMTRLTKRIQVRVRRRAFEHAVRLPLHRVHQLKSGGVSSLLREDAGGAAELVFGMIYNPWRATIQLLGTLAILSSVDWRLVLGSLLLLPAIWLTHRTWINRIRPVFRDIRQTRQSVDAHTTEAFGGMRVVKGFGRERGEAGRFVSSVHFMARQEFLAWWRSRVVDITWQILVPLASAAVLVYGGRRVLDGTLTIGDVMMFSAYLLMLLGPLETLASTATELQTHLAGFDRVLDILGEETEFASERAAMEVDRASARGRITVADVSFRYPGTERDVLKDVSLDVRAGETIALIGPSGSGKTTLCNLVARFHDPTRGSIALDGADLRRIEVRSYRRLLGIVEQDVFLFDGTVGENIAYARPDASREEVMDAARVANAAEFIERMEKGYETVIGERGVRLSGGQKQRIAIARAVLADPLILILDEATSNLDSESEALIQRSLWRLMEGRTCFVIAHRLSTVRHADRIVVLEDGGIVEVGSHEVLLERGGRYAEVLRLQVEGTGGALKGNGDGVVVGDVEGR